MLAEVFHCVDLLRGAMLIRIEIRIRTKGRRSRATFHAIAKLQCPTKSLFVCFQKCRANEQTFGGAPSYAHSSRIEEEDKR